MNKTILIGRLTRDVQVRTNENNNTIGAFTLAIARPYKKEDGQTETDFINCIAFNKRAESIDKYCKKGTQLAVEGRIQTRDYTDKEGTKRYVTEVLVENFYLLGSKSEGAKVVEEPMVESDPFADLGEDVTLTDDDLPF